MDKNENEGLKGNGRSQVMRAAGLVGSLVLVSRLVGLLRDIITKYYLGADSLEANAFATANRFPETIFLVIAGGAIGSAFIPIFSAYFSEENEAAGWRLFSAIINLLTIVSTIVAVITAVFAPNIVTLFIGAKISAEPELLPLTVKLMRIMLISPVIFGVSGVFMGALNARQHFLLPALAPIVYNLGIIVGVILIKPPVIGLAVGTVIGALGHLLIQIPGLRQKGAKYTAVFTLNDPDVQQVLRLMAPRVLGLSFSQINKFISLSIIGASALIDSSLVANDTALMLIIMPQGVLGQALGIAAFPTLATLAAQSAYDEMRQIITDSLRIMLFLGLPITVAFVLLRTPLISFVFERGAFTADSTRVAAWALLFYAFGLIPLIFIEVLARSFYALSDTLTPVLTGGVQILFMGGLSYWFSRFLFPSLDWLPVGGIALAFSLSNVLEIGLLLWLLRRKMRRLNGRSLLDASWRMGFGAMAMGLVMWGVLGLMETAVSWLQLILGGLVGTVVYLTTSFLLQVTELQQFIEFGRRRLSR